MGIEGALMRWILPRRLRRLWCSLGRVSDLFDGLGGAALIAWFSWGAWGPLVFRFWLGHAPLLAVDRRFLLGFMHGAILVYAVAVAALLLFWALWGFPLAVARCGLLSWLLLRRWATSRWGARRSGGCNV